MCRNVSAGAGHREPSVTANSGDSFSRGPDPTKSELNFVDAVFGGLLRSDVTCRCVSHTMLDSLELCVPVLQGVAAEHVLPAVCK